MSEEFPDIERAERERKYVERGKALLSKYGGSEISEEDRKEACIRLGLSYKSRKEEIQEIKQELNELAIKVGLRTRPSTLKEALSGSKQKEKKDVAIFPTSTE